MKVDICDIPAEGLHLEITEDGNELQAIAGEVDFLILSPVSADLTLLKSEGEIFVRGDMTAPLKLQCARCLKEVEHRINSRIDIVYTLTPEHKAKEKELTLEDVGADYLEGDEIDINAVLVEQLSLDTPMQPVCRPDCKGLCPKCGADLNQRECSCIVTEHTDQKFAMLKELKLNKK
ncbi:MAG: DUF177 domain-containing protein [Deltaproteobacteria bacterium]|nr:DUF177 domain-containing protein [Deltaproteobacteria bacterium]